ncbi:hypothetical protein BC749_10331 [Flavobacterium araucananum]|nr:hypothetical protein BC749_10331 [Flavobacterium araucananum]
MFLCFRIKDTQRIVASIDPGIIKDDLAEKRLNTNTKFS